MLNIRKLEVVTYDLLALSHRYINAYCYIGGLNWEIRMSAAEQTAKPSRLLLRVEGRVLTPPSISAAIAWPFFFIYISTRLAGHNLEGPA